jgi:hypothetical protein
VRYLEPGRGRPRGRLTLAERLWAVAVVLALLIAAGAALRLF